MNRRPVPHANRAGIWSSAMKRMIAPAENSKVMNTPESHSVHHFASGELHDKVSPVVK
ncbi:hypothetical protein D3C87_2044840 [compost metagenome]